MHSKCDLDSDDDSIFLGTKMKPVVRSIRHKGDETSDYEQDELFNPNSGKKLSNISKQGKRKEIDEDDEDAIIISEKIASPSTPNKVIQERERACIVNPTSLKEKTVPNLSSANLITCYYSPQKELHTSSSGTDKVISDSSSVLKEHDSPNAENIHKRLKLNVDRSDFEVSDCFSDDFNSYDGDSTNFVDNELQRNENSSLYYEGLKNIVNYELKKQKRLERETSTFQHLFLNDEYDYFEKFLQMPREAALLFARMLCRKKDWHRVSNIKYSDISNNIEEVFGVLSEKKFFDLNIEEEELEVLLDLLYKDQIQVLCKIFHIKVGKGKKNKSNFIKAVLTSCKTQKSPMDMWNISNKIRLKVFKEEVLKCLGKCAKMNRSALEAFNRLLLLFSLTPSQEDDKWTNEIHTMIELICKKTRYPNYRVHPMVIFKVRDDFIRYEKAVKLMDEFELCIANKNHEQLTRIGQKAKEEFERILDDESFRNRFSSLPSYLKKYSAGTIYAKLLTQYWERNKKEKNPKDAIYIMNVLLNQGLFLTTRKGDWYTCLFQAYEDSGEPEKAVTTLSIALNDQDINEVQRLILQQKGLRILKKKKNGIGDLASRYGLRDLCTITISDPAKVEIKGKALERKVPGCKSVFVEQTENEKVYYSVEELAIGYYRKNGFTNGKTGRKFIPEPLKCRVVLFSPEGIHSEGSVIQTIYFLLFFELIYDKSPPGVFQSHYQKEPMDLMHRSFYKDRKDSIDSLLNEIEKWTIHDFEEAIDKVFTENNDTNCVINWRDCNTELYQHIVRCLGLRELALICRRLASNFRVYRAGFPDLTVWNSETRKCKFVEVKGPNDQLSPKQSLWLDFLRKNNIDCEVCYVKHKSSPNLQNC